MRIVMETVVQSCQDQHLIEMICAVGLVDLEYSCSDEEYRETSNIRHTIVGNKIVDHSDVVGASPVGAAPTTSSFST